MIFGALARLRPAGSAQFFYFDLSDFHRHHAVSVSAEACLSSSELFGSPTEPAEGLI